MDTINSRLFIWGGGHNDYAGNEIYVLDLTAQTMERFWGPSPFSDDFWLGACPDPEDSKLSDGTPISRHTYGGLAYLEHVNLFWIYGGSRACGSGGFGRDTWTFDPATMEWKNEFPTGIKPDAGIVISAYDPVTKKVFVKNNNHFFTYEYGDSPTSQVNHWIRLDNSFIPGYAQMSGTIDPVRRKFIFVGGASSPGTYLIDLDGPDYTPQELVTTNGAVIEGTQAPGVAFDPETSRILAWDGSRVSVNPSEVWSLDVDRGEWTLIQTEGSGMSVSGSTGTFGRWRYVPSLNQFVSVISVNQNARLFSTDIDGDTTPPTGSVIDPADGDTVAGAFVHIQIDANDPESGIAHVQIRIDGSPSECALDHSFPYECMWNTFRIGNGTHTIEAVATNNIGNTVTTDSISVTVDNGIDTIDPTGTITAPVDGSPVSGSAVSIQVDASDNFAVKSVQILIDGNTSACPLDEAAPYECVWDTTLESDGFHTIEAEILDFSNNSATTSPINLITGPVESLSVTAVGGTVSSNPHWDRLFEHSV